MNSALLEPWVSDAIYKLFAWHGMNSLNWITGEKICRYCNGLPYRQKGTMCTYCYGVPPK